MSSSKDPTYLKNLNKVLTIRIQDVKGNVKLLRTYYET